MSTLVYMKMLERTPAQYDRRMRVLTFGRIDRVKRDIASTWIETGDDVLEIGCGTGSLAALMTSRGARVIGIDVSEPMLAVARTAAPNAEFRHLTATELDRLGPQHFDRVVATLTFSELTEEEQDYVLRACRKLLKPGGTLVVADEVPPASWWQRSLFYLIRWKVAAVTFLLTRSTTHVLRGFEQRLERAGYRVRSCARYLMGTLALIIAEKAEE